MQQHDEQDIHLFCAIVFLAFSFFMHTKVSETEWREYDRGNGKWQMAFRKLPQWKMLEMSRNENKKKKKMKNKKNGADDDWKGSKNFVICQRGEIDAHHIHIMLHSTWRQFNEWKCNGIFRWTEFIFRFGFWIERKLDSEIESNRIESPLVRGDIRLFGSSSFLYCIWFWLLFLLVHRSYHLECRCRFLHNIDSELDILVEGRPIFAI